MYYINDGARRSVAAQGGFIEYKMGKIEYGTSIGLVLTAYVDLRFTAIDGNGQRRFKKDHRDCLVEETIVKKKVMTDEKGFYFESNDLYTTAGGVSLGPVLIPDKYKIRLYEEKESDHENVE